ncbi:unnamed protein product [Lymnaea stagnalis]|uniref:Replication factor A protein 3 n=1 Tax=Lymnaea stagnalis TaxID=6523 RepID=A0AAV2HGX8_LYMST
MSLDEHKTPRISGKLLPNYIGKSVCLLGSAKYVDSNGKFFTLTTCDKQDVQILMQEQPSQLISGLVEVHGDISSKNTVQCNNIVVFPDNASDNFDFSLYQKAVELIHCCPNHYVQGGNIED